MIERIRKKDKIMTLGDQINYFHPDKALVLQKANDCYLDKENWFDTERLLA